MPTKQEALVWLKRYRELVKASESAKAPHPSAADLNVQDRTTGAVLTASDVKATLYRLWRNNPADLNEGFVKVTGKSLMHPRKSIRAIDNALVLLGTAPIETRARATDAVRQAVRGWLAAKEEDTSSRRAGVLGLQSILDLIDAETLDALLHRPSRSEFGASDEEDVVERAGAGNMSSVARITYTDGSVVAFKKAESTGEMTSLSGREHGIPDTNAEANLAGRSVATSDLADLLGLGNVPKTKYAVHGGEVGTTQTWAEGRPCVKTALQPLGRPPEPFATYYPLMMGIVFDGAGFAPGLLERDDPIELEAAYNAGQIWFSRSVNTHVEQPDLTDAALQKSLADAHLFDLLTGQLDRNPGNFVFGTDDDGNAVANLIDNDICFGSATSLEEQAEPALPAFLPGLPALVDADTAERFLALEETALRELLEAHGMSDAEQDAAAARLVAIQEHLTELEEEGELVDEWNAETAAVQLQSADNYLRRIDNETLQEFFQTPDKASSLQRDAQTGGVLFTKAVANAQQGDLPGLLAGAMATPGTLRALWVAHPAETRVIMESSTYDQKKMLCEPYVLDDLSEDEERAREAATWVGSMMDPDAPDDERGDTANQQYGYLLSRLVRGNTSSDAVAPLLDVAAESGRISPCVVAKVLLAQREEFTAAALESGGGVAALDHLAGAFDTLCDDLQASSDPETDSGRLLGESLAVARLLYFAGAAAYNQRTGASVDTQKGNFDRLVSQITPEVVGNLLEAVEANNAVAIGPILTNAGFPPVTTPEAQRSKEEQQIDFVRSTLVARYT